MEVERESPLPPELEVGECGGGGHVGHRGPHCWAPLKRKQGRQRGPLAEPWGIGGEPRAGSADLGTKILEAFSVL